MEPIRVLIVEDSVVFARGLEEVLRRAGRFIVVGLADNRAGALALAEQIVADVVLVDLRIPLEPERGQAAFRHGVETIAALKACRPTLPVLAMSFRCTGRWPVEALEAGASGFLCKDVPSGDFVARLWTLLRRETVWGAAPAHER
jgi:two-component system NarL family response regulator